MIRSILNTERFRFARYYKYIRLDIVFFNIIIIMKGEDMKFMRQSQTIKVINVDNKDWKKNTSMETYYRFLYAESSAIHRTAAKQTC